MSFIAALQFLTSIPLPWQGKISPEALRRSLSYFPVIGLIIGFILAGVDWLLLLVLPPAVVNALLIVSLVLITGALHLDGLADTCDGIASHKTVAERLAIMHDSRSGAFGVVGVVLLLLVKYVALNNLPHPLMMTTLIFMPVVSRWAMVYAIFAYPYARPTGLGKVFKDGARWPRFTTATAITLIVAILLVPLIKLTVLVVIVGIWLTTTLAAVYFKSKFSGLTGDNYGAINELAETSVLIIILMLSQFGMT